jgi:hypothetical protein
MPGKRIPKLPSASPLRRFSISKLGFGNQTGELAQSTVFTWHFGSKGKVKYEVAIPEVAY